MSIKLWCPDCVTQTIIGQMSIADGDEFVCDDCKQVFYVRIERGLTPHAPDAAEPCQYCKRVHDSSLACPEYEAQTAAQVM